MRRLLSFLAKAAISIALLYLASRRVNAAGLGQRLRELDPSWIAFILTIVAVQLGLVALRWREIVAVCGAELSRTTALRFSFIGLFFSQVLPSTVGGDAARIWLLARNGAGWPVASYSVLIDRVIGVSALAVLVVGCLPWTLNLVQDPVARTALALIGFGILSAAATFFALGHAPAGLMQRWWLTRHLGAASLMAGRLFRFAAGLRVAALSIVIQMLTVVAAWGAAMAAHVAIDFAHVLFLILPVILISTIPVSIAGWGVREGAMVLAFSYAGLAERDGLIVSLLFGAATLAVGAVGGIVWIASGYRWRSLKTIESDTALHDRRA